jgi:hypothetical protein
MAMMCTTPASLLGRPPLPVAGAIKGRSLGRFLGRDCSCKSRHSGTAHTFHLATPGLLVLGPIALPIFQVFAAQIGFSVPRLLFASKLFVAAAPLSLFVFPHLISMGKVLLAVKGKRGLFGGVTAHLFVLATPVLFVLRPSAPKK